MDSVTQFTLGAALGFAAVTPKYGARYGARAAIWGGVCATLPDLDTFVPFDTAVDSFTWHRGYSHSFFVLAVLSPVVALVLAKLNRAPPDRSQHFGAHFRIWWLAAALCLLTHPLLDCFTVYGTQVLLPFSDYPVSWSTIFIIDPLYTLALGAGLISALVTRRIRWNTLGILLSCGYLAFTLAAKGHVESAVSRHLTANALHDATVLTTPTPFNAIVWRILIRDGERYFEGFDSLIDGTDTLTFVELPTGDAMLDRVPLSPDIERLQWFSHGHYVVRDTGSSLHLCDQRMGVLDRLVFCFVVANKTDDTWQVVQPATTSRDTRTQEDIGSVMEWIWQRIWAPMPDAIPRLP